MTEFERLLSSSGRSITNSTPDGQYNVSIQSLSFVEEVPCGNYIDGALHNILLYGILNNILTDNSVSLDPQSTHARCHQGDQGAVRNVR